MVQTHSQRACQELEVQDNLDYEVINSRVPSRRETPRVENPKE